MFKNVRYGLVLLGVMFPLLAQAKLLTPDELVIEAQRIAHGQVCSSGASKIGLRICDISFTVTPTFTNLCLGTIQSGIYTITNNTPVSILLNYIRIQNNDGLPDAATAVVIAPTNSCVAGTRLAAGASCNIQVNLQPLALGTFNRVLQVGIDTRQVEIDATPITVAANCVTAGPTTPAVPTPPAPTPPPGSQFQVTILGASTVTNAGPSVINGDVDVSPGSAITGFPPGTVINGTFHAADATAAAAQTAALNYYNSAVGLPCGTDLTGQDLGGRTLSPGVYCFSSSAQLTGALTLNGGPNSAFVFQIGSTLTTASNSNVVLTGGVTSGNVTWAVGSSATLGTNSAFAGIIDATTSITITTGTSLAGRAWALNGAVTLDSNLVNPG